MNSLEGLTIRDYALGIGSIIGPTNIHYILKISQGRVCTFLSSEEIARHLVDKQKSVIICTHTIELRAYVSRTKRLILSNVSPLIPCRILEAKFSDHNVTRKSSITYMKSGFNDIGYTHLRSFRRSVYIDPEDVNKLPPTFKSKERRTGVMFLPKKLLAFCANKKAIQLNTVKPKKLVHRNLK